MKRKLVITAAVAASVVIGAGAAAAFADDGPRTGVPDVRVVEPAAAADRVEVSSSKLGAAEVIAAALRHTPGTAVGADLEDDGADAGSWHVDLVEAGGAEYTVVVSPDTGKAVGSYRDTDDDADDAAENRADLAALKGAGVDAREAALAVAGKGTVTDVDLDDDGRTAAWSVDTAEGGEWLVDARTGKVTQDQDD
ncbi:PepSY domain-containing protein [Streptomyces sp. NPDC050263]|uniref:PepSY domain-containing protein n=1 Tax=Streptomyces sp. NPDC050263 TaxID=3155037 RepID=UPI0034424765